MFEPRQGFAQYEPQIMDPRERSSSRQREYQFAVSMNSRGDILDYAMDGGVTLTPRRRRISEDGVIAEYAVVLNRQPLNDVTVSAEDVRLVDANDEPLQQLRFVSSQTVTFTRSNWNREQVIRVTAVDDMIAEDTHYAVIKHTSSSLDPNFNGPATPFLYGSNVTLQIFDNDAAGVRISRRHVFVGEGGAIDRYEVVLRSQPWYPVTVRIVPLNAGQTIVTPSEIKFQPGDWNIAQRVVVSAVDDTVSESEYGGLHSGGKIVHFAESKDPRYRTRRPLCFDIPACDPEDETTCLVDSFSDSQVQTVRMCDITNECDFPTGNGACISDVEELLSGQIPARFGSAPLDPSIEYGNEFDTDTTLSYTELQVMFAQQQMDRNVSKLTDASAYFDFTDPPSELKAFVLSFLGLLNMAQVRELRKSPTKTLRAVCGGVIRLETMRWAFEEWPKGYTALVLDVVFQMFPDILPRHVWNCGMSSISPGHSLNVTILDNDPGITLSAKSLTVAEQSESSDECDNSQACATYTIVLNAPPSTIGSQPALLESSICLLDNSNKCGFWSDFSLFAAAAYDTFDVSEDISVSIAVDSNAQLRITPEIVTFSMLNWFVPQTVTVRAAFDEIAEREAHYTISHRVQNSQFGYTDSTAFWFQGELVNAQHQYPYWEANNIPYNEAPMILHSPDHRSINVNVIDDDIAGVEVIVNQPEHIISAKEAQDSMDWVGDYATSLGFSDVSLTLDSTSESGLASALEGILVFAPNSTTYIKFHLPQLHPGDSELEMFGAKVMMYQTPYKVFNVSDNSSESSSADTGDSSFEKRYHTRVTVVENDWTPESLQDGTIKKPLPVSFLRQPSVEMSAVIDKSRTIEIDIIELAASVSQTRLPVVSLEIDVLDGVENTTTTTTQLCSSQFERSLRPRLILQYRFPNYFRDATVTQSSTATNPDTTELLAAELAVDGIRSHKEFASTEEELEPWFEAELPNLKKIGTVAVFMPKQDITGDGGDTTRHVVIIASFLAFNSEPLTLSDALKYGCPEQCPQSQRFSIRRGVLLWDLHAGTRAIRIYQEGFGSLRVAEVEAFCSSVSVAPTADGKGIRSRLKYDWTSTRTSDSWRLLQTVRDSEEENLALRMPTRQSSTFPEQALSLLAVDGENQRRWDPTLLRGINTTSSEAVGIADVTDMEAGSTRTSSEPNPWWEVDLGEILPISSVVVYPYIGEAGRNFCDDTPDLDEAEQHLGDLYSYSRLDRLLEIETPFVQEFEILVSDLSLYGDSAASVSVASSTTLSFSCFNHTSSVTWSEAFTKGRFVVVRRKGTGVLMLNEVEVYRWNPAKSPRYILLDMFSSGTKPMALTEVQLFPPSGLAALDDGVPGHALPVSYTIHSKSSQRAASGAGSAASLSSVDHSQCYISASASSTHEWVVLELERPTPIGLIEIDGDVSRCGNNIDGIEAISIGSYGASIRGVSSAVSGVCALNAAGRLVDPSSNCDTFICQDNLCNSQTMAQGNSVSLAMIDFTDVVVFGKLGLTPLSRLPLSVNEHRSLIIRDNPAILWTFDDQPIVFVDGKQLVDNIARTTAAHTLTDIAQSLVLDIADSREQTFFSNAVVLQPALSAFTLEFWVRFTDTIGAQLSIANLHSANGEQTAFSKIRVADNVMLYQLIDSTSDRFCEVETPLDPPVSTWVHIGASYNPSTSSLSLSVRYWNEADVVFVTATVRCALTMEAKPYKFIQFGKSAGSATNDGFKGTLASVSWYLTELSTRALLDHFHDFFDGALKETSNSHNTYSIQLASRPVSTVTIDVNAEDACYMFNVCNTSAYPSILKIPPEDWARPMSVRVLATDDNLFEGLHSANLFHTASSYVSYQYMSSASTAILHDANNDTLTDTATDWIRFVKQFDSDLMLKRLFDSDAASLAKQQQILDTFHTTWAIQEIQHDVVSSEPFNVSLTIQSVFVSIVDLTVPGIEFSTSSLVVSEDGKGNDYQVVLLSEPKQIVTVLLNSETDCYRECFIDPVCPSQLTSHGSDACGIGQSNMLCNVSVTPEVLYFSGLNWSIPQTVRVVAIDDMLDEADLHSTTIKAYSVSADPVYHNLELPDIAVFVEDNDATDILYSTKHVKLSESNTARINGTLAQEFGYTGYTNYSLSLLTEPWANVTIAMSNEANKSCYRSCGYPFDEVRCGLPRQQSVSLVKLGTNSSLEQHEISLAIPRVVEIQRIKTLCDHIDQIFRLELAGGYAEEIQAVTFLFNADFKRTYRTSREITAAVTYGRTFRLGFSDRNGNSAALDGFASAADVGIAINTLLGGGQFVRVTQSILYEQSVIRWVVTFTRLLSTNLVFPLLTVTGTTTFQGTLTTSRLQTAAAHTGTFELRYGSPVASNVGLVAPVSISALDLNSLLSSLNGVLNSSVSRSLLSNAYGTGFMITFHNVTEYFQLEANASGIVSATNAATAGSATIVQTQAPASLDGSFVIEYISPISSLKIVNKTNPIPWNASAAFVASEISEMTGLGRVSVTSRQHTPEGARAWNVTFSNNHGNLSSLRIKSSNMSGPSARVLIRTIRDGESLGGTFAVRMGGEFKRIDAASKRVDTELVALKNTTPLLYNASAANVQKALLDLAITGETLVTRTDVDCDSFGICNGYIWSISFVNSPGNLPPISVVSSITGHDAVLSAKTVANGTFLGGFFRLTLELLDIETQAVHTGTTWWLPVNVSAIGMDEALEAFPFVRSNREAEYDPETRGWRGIKFDKGVRVYREGPFLDGGYTWRLEWALQDYIRFEDLRISIDTSRVTQETDVLKVDSEFTLDGAGRCAVVPNAHFVADTNNVEGSSGFCMYDIVNVTVQERFLCNFTIENPWIVYTPRDWCIPQSVDLEVVDDWVDEQTIQNGNVTYSNVTHNIFSDDMLYLNFLPDQVEVSAASDDIAKVLVSERLLEVSENGDIVANYTLQLNSEPLYNVKVVVLPWLDNNQTLCYRFGMCNLTIPVDKYLFTPRNWNIPQRVMVYATNDDLDEYDVHSTGISHVAYSDDVKYNEIAIPKIDVRVYDNDASAFIVLKTQVNVVEGGAYDEYSVVLATEPFAKVMVSVKNVGTKGNFVVPSPTQLVFTWLNWNQSQTVHVQAFDDQTEDSLTSSSLLVHSISSNDLIYAKLRDLTSVRAFITDNDKSGIELSRSAFTAVESNITILNYQVRLTSEPWYPVTVIPNASNGCYQRFLPAPDICNVTMLTKRVYFGAGNWSNWVEVSFTAVDDWLVEASIHDALITHSTLSIDPLYNIGSYSNRGGDIVVSITDNDVPFVNIVLQLPGGNRRLLLTVAEGGFNDSYRISLASEPYREVRITLIPSIEGVINIDTNTITLLPQIGIDNGASTSIGATPASVRSIELVFTCLDWMRERVINVMAIDDKIPEVATQYTLIRHSIASTDSSYNISNSSLGIVSVNVSISDRETIPPPLPVTALLDSSGSKIDVVFDSTVYHAATMNYSITSVANSTSRTVTYVVRLKSFACSLVFDFSASTYSLGSGATCVWLDFQTLRLQLGSGPSISPKDSLVLAPCRSFQNQICQTEAVLRARYTSRAYSQASVEVKAPAIRIIPVPVLMVPDEVGNCGSWTVDATLSTGSGGREFTTVTWFALPISLLESGVLASTTSSVQAITTIYSRLNVLCLKYSTDWWTGASSGMLVPLSEVSSTGLSLLSTMAQLRSACYLRSNALNMTEARSLTFPVNSSLIETSATYIIGLGLANAFGEQAVQTKRIAVRSTSAPLVYVIGDSVVSVTRTSEPLVLQVGATTTCALIDMSAIKFRWFASSKPSDGGITRIESLNASNTAKDPKTFRFARNALEANRQYTFRAEAYFSDSSSDGPSSASIVVNVGASVPVVTVSGGSRSIGVKEYLALVGNVVDPDNSAVPFQFVWTCSDVTVTNASTNCLNALTNETLSLSGIQSLNLTVLPFHLSANRTLLFSLIASKAGKSATASTTVWTLPLSGPAVVTTTVSTKINPSVAFKLSAEVASEYPFTMRWIQYQGDLNISASSDANPAFSLPLTSQSNAIVKNSLTPGLTYVFRLVATDINNNTGFGSIVVNVNAPPSSGTLTVSPQSGYAITDKFVLSCAHWTDDPADLPLTYSFASISTSRFETILEESADTTSLTSSLLKQAAPLVPPQISPSATINLLPPSQSPDSENVTIVAFITDALGATAIAYDSVEIILPALAKSQPVAFVSSMIGTTGMSNADGPQKVQQALAAAMVMQSAFSDSSSTGCAKSSAATSCSSHGLCDSNTGKCVCEIGYLGSACEFEVGAVRAVNMAILNTVSTSAEVIDPTTSGLSQQALVADTMLQATPTAFGDEDLSTVTSLTDDITGNAFSLSNPQDFVDSTAGTVVSVISSVVSVGSTFGTTSAKSGSSRRRLATETSCGSTSPDSRAMQATYQSVITSLQSISALASQSLLKDEPASVVRSDQVDIYSSMGDRLRTSHPGGLEVNLTDLAHECLPPNLFVNVFSMKTTTHSKCSLYDAVPISRSTIVTVHSQKAFESATSGNGKDRVELQYLDSSNTCIKRAVAASASTTSRRLEATTEASTTSWQPLLVATIPHERTLSSVEKRNFTTACRVWNADFSEWSSETCFKDETLSTFELTVCYCNAIGKLEVIITLEETPDFYEVSKDLYRDDPVSNVPAVTIVILIGICAAAGCTGQRWDAKGVQIMKEQVVKKLSRAKWTELETRTQTPLVFEGFEAYCARKKLEKSQESTIEKTGVTEATTIIQSTAAGLGATTLDSISSTPAANVASPLTDASEVNPEVELPDESRILIESSSRAERQYRHFILLFRLMNALLAVVGLVLLFVGIDFVFVLGNTTAELLLYVYGKNLGTVIAIFGAALIATGGAGQALAKKGGSNGARVAYTFWLSILLIVELVFAAGSSNYLDSFHELPKSLFATLKTTWDAIPVTTRNEIQSMYGCCGFGSIKEEAVCPEEALESYPPRACFVVLEEKAQAIFSTSFVYLEWVFLIEILCIAIANGMVKWRELRLLQLAGEPASSVTGTRSADRAMLSSQMTVLLLASLPPVYYLFACVSISALFYGIDLLLPLNFVSREIVAQLFGLELGILLITGAVVHLVILAKGIYSLQTRNARALLWFIGIYIAFLFPCLAMVQYFRSLEENFQLNPAITLAVQNKYLAIPRSALIQLETSMQCCGFASNNQGTCLQSANPLPTCQVTIEKAILHGVSLLNDRLLIFLVAEIAVISISGVLWFCIRRFAVKPSIAPQPTALEIARRFAPMTREATRWSLVAKVCSFTMMLFNLSGLVIGLFIVLVGIDAFTKLNVLQISYLLVAFDRHVGIYVTAFGGVVEVFSCVGLASALSHSHTLLWIYACIAMGIFAASFGGLGATYHFQSIMTSDEKIAHHFLEQIWIGAGSDVKQFTQNTFDCCGFDRVAAANGTFSFTYPAELESWQQTTIATIIQTYSAAGLKAAGAYSTVLPSSWISRSLQETTTRVIPAPLCPENAVDGCSDHILEYLLRNSDYAIIGLLVVAVFAIITALCAFIVLLQTTILDAGKKITYPIRWRLKLVRIVVLLVSFACSVSALTAFYIGVDITAQTTLFSSPLLQLLFSPSVGVTLLIFAGVDLALNIYTVRGVIYFTVHRVFMNGVGRTLLAIALWIGVGLTGYLSRFSAATDWRGQLVDYLDYRWNTLAPSKQHTIGITYSCCGFNDPALVTGRGIVFDRSPVGFSCSLANSRGCCSVLVDQVGGSFAWLFQYFLGLALVETLSTVLAVAMVRELIPVKPEEWFRVASRIYYAAAKFRSEARKSHLVVSVYFTFDPKLTRSQRVVCILTALTTTLAIYSGYFATQGCHRKALKTCEQPSIWAILGMGFLYGGCAGYGAQALCRSLFELVRNRCDDETQEVAVVRQRKERVLIFRKLFQRRGFTEKPTLASANGNEVKPDGEVKKVSFSREVASTIETSQATTEERWYNWIARFLFSFFQLAALVQFIVGCGVATLMGLVILGYQDTLYNVKVDQGPRELLVLAIAMGFCAVIAWVAVDQHGRRFRTSYTAFAATALACIMLVVTTLIGIYVMYQLLDEVTAGVDLSDQNWSIRSTGFSIVQRLEQAWHADSSNSLRNAAQQQLHCCGFRNASDYAYRPCPSGGVVQVEYQAMLVNGSVMTKSQDEEQDLGGCLPLMLAQFERTANGITYFAVAMCSIEVLMAISAVFLAQDLLAARDAKLKLRVPSMMLRDPKARTDVKHTFEKVVGLKIAAPARGKILSQMLASSLDSVTPRVAAELATVPISPQLIDTQEDDRQARTVRGTGAHTTQVGSTSSTPKSLLVSTLARRQGQPSFIDGDDELKRVPYPASVVYVVFAIAGIWNFSLVYAIVVSSTELGSATAWYCLISWGVGILFQWLVIEPAMIFARIIVATLSDWWTSTWIAQILRRGRAVLRIQPDAATLAARYYASLSLYERIRYNAAVRIQRRLMTLITRQRFLQKRRELKQQQHKQVAEQRRVTLRKTIENFTEEEVTAFSIIFRDADTAQLGLVPHTIISHSIYQLGVNVPSSVVQQALAQFDPAYADLVDFEHFLYGMHCARMHHQHEQSRNEVEQNNCDTKEEVVSSSMRYGPTADPRAKIIVKRQNLLRELKEKRDSLTYKLMGKVGRLPPLRRQKSAKNISASTADTSLDRDSVDDVKPVGTYVLMQNRKLSPTKRALEVILKKKHRDDKQSSSDIGAPLSAIRESGMSSTPSSPPPPRKKAKAMMDQLKNRSPRGVSREHLRTGTGKRKDESDVDIESYSTQETEVSTFSVHEEAVSNFAETTSARATDAQEIVTPIPDLAPKLDSEVASVAETAVVSSVGNISEAKPMGTFMLGGQHPNSGKGRALENVLKKQTSGTTRQLESSEAGQPSVMHTDVEKSEATRTITAPPKSPEKTAPSAKNNLEKALKKQLGKKASALSKPE